MMEGRPQTKSLCRYKKNLNREHTYNACYMCAMCVDEYRNSQCFNVDVRYMSCILFMCPRSGKNIKNRTIYHYDIVSRVTTKNVHLYKGMCKHTCVCVAQYNILFHLRWRRQLRHPRRIWMPTNPTPGSVFSTKMMKERP